MKRENKGKRKRYGKKPGNQLRGNLGLEEKGIDFEGEKSIRALKKKTQQPARGAKTGRKVQEKQNPL